MIHSSRERGVAQGPVLVDPTADAKNEQDRAALCRGQILGGGISFVTRELGLVMTPEHDDVVVTSRVAAAVSRRFHTYQKGIQVGVAKAHTDFWVELAVYPLYKDNLDRYMHVVRAIAIQESATQQAQRIIDLERKLFCAKDAARAAVELEAIGRPAVDTLMKGMQSSDREVQFYAAEALAYLGRREAAEPLGRIARDEPAFRKSALTRPGGARRPGRRRATPQLAGDAERGNPLRRLPRPLDRQPQRPGHQGRAARRPVQLPRARRRRRADDPRHAEFSRRGRRLRPPTDVLHSLVDQRRQPDHDHQLPRRRNLREQVQRSRRGPEARRFQQGGRRDSGDRRTRRDVSRRRSSDPGGEGRRRLAQPLRGRNHARGRTEVPAAHGRRGQRHRAAGEGESPPPWVPGSDKMAAKQPACYNEGRTPD